MTAASPKDDLVERLRDHENEGVTGSDRFHLRNEAADRIEALEREIAAVRELMNLYNLGGWTDAVAPMERAIKAEAALADALKALEAAMRYLRQHAISHDPTRRPMRSRCEICEAEWGGDDAEHHGDGCPFDAARAKVKP